MRSSGGRIGICGGMVDRYPPLMCSMPVAPSWRAGIRNPRGIFGRVCA